MQQSGDIPARVGRYLLYEEIARGGMASVHLGRLEGPNGFKRTVAVKRLHGTFGHDPEFVSLFLDEARIAARIEHPNVVPVLDVVQVDREVLLVMEYVHGESLAELLFVCQKQKQRAPLRIVAQVIVNVLTGLHAAHDTCDENGEPLQIVHRDVSPHNIMVSADGIARVVDFGIARAERRMTATTKEGNVRGKLAYMAPEQLDESGNVGRRADIYAAALVFWEAVVGRRLFEQEVSVIIARKLSSDGEPPSVHVPDLPAEIDAIIAKGMARDQNARYATALEMARAIEAAVPPVSPREIAEWVAELAGPKLRERASVVAASTGTNRGSNPSLGVVRPQAGGYVSTNHLTLPKQSIVPKRAALAIAAVVALGAIGTCVAVTRSGAPPVALSAGIASATAAPAGALAPTAETTASVAVAPAASAEPANVTFAGELGGAAGAPPKRKPPKAGGAAAGTSTAKTSGGKRPECDPPWRVDEHGVRMLKKECF